MYCNICLVVESFAPWIDSHDSPIKYYFEDDLVALVDGTIFLRFFKFTMKISYLQNNLEL